MLDYNLDDDNLAQECGVLLSPFCGLCQRLLYDGMNGDSERMESAEADHPRAQSRST